MPGFGDLVALVELRAGSCNKLAHLLDVSKLIHLEVLDLWKCPLRALLGLGSAISLREIQVPFLRLEECRGLQMLTMLRVVWVEGWCSQGLPRLNTVPKLEKLHIFECEGVDVLTGLSNSTSLLKLVFYRCDFKDVSCVSQFSTLRELRITHCAKLERLPDIHKLTRLRSLEITWCESLRIWEGLRGSGLLENRWRCYVGSSTFGVPDSELPDLRWFSYLKELCLLPPY